MPLSSKYQGGTNANHGPAAAFWLWFTRNESRFTKLDKNDSEQALAFLNELIGQMAPFNPWLKALAGPYSGEKFELIITADGDIALFCKVEELIDAAPDIENWVFTAHKPALGFEGISIDLYGKEFSTLTTQFYPIVQENYPDEVSIIITHTSYDKEEDNHFQAGGMIYLENGLGEVNTATKIDHYETGPAPLPGDGIETIPIIKLADYLGWREKEFVEKYESVHTERPEESFNLLEAEDGNGKLLLATVDASFREWPFRPAYPWLLQVDINYEGEKGGLPSEEQLNELHQIEEEIVDLLTVSSTTYFLGHRTYDNYRNIYFYTNEYKMNAMTLHQYLAGKKTDYEIVFFIRRDKYWRTMEQYLNVQAED